MTGVEDGSETNTRLKRPDDHGVDVIIDNVSLGSMVDGVDDFIVTVVFVTIKVLGLTTVAYLISESLEEEMGRGVPE